MINNLTKMGIIIFILLGVEEMFIMDLIQDNNTVIGFSIISICCFSGVGIAFLIRGKQLDDFNKSHYSNNRGGEMK